MPNLDLTFDCGEPSLSVRRFSIREGISACFTASVWARSPDPSIDIEAIVGKPASLRVESGLAFARLGGARTWTGVCGYMEQTRVEPTGLSSYYLRIVPALWLLRHRRNHRLFQQQSIPEIADVLLGEWGIEPTWGIDRGAYPKLELRIQYGESDYDFLNRLLEEAGIAFTFPDDGGAGTRLALGDALHQGTPRAAPPIPYVDNPNRASEREFVTRVRLAHEVRPGAHDIRDHDFRNPGYALLGKGPRAAAPEDRLERYVYAPGAFLVETDKGDDTPFADLAGKNRHDETTGQDRATRALHGQRVGKRSVVFETNAVDLLPGLVFSVDGHMHPEVDGQKLLVAETAFEGAHGGEWTMEGRALLASDPYRPPLVTRKPRIGSAQSATVTGAGEIHTDEFGRVRVRFPWDRGDEQSSCWMRVNQGWAGSAYGMMHIPRVGQEVLVAFVDGNPDQPVVMGRVHDQMQPVPHALPDDKTRSTWKSDSSPGSGGFNEIMFEDKKGDELVSAQAEKNQRQLIKNDEAITVGHDRTKAVGNDETDTVDHDRTEVTGGDRSQNVVADRATVIGGDRAKLVKGTETERTEGHQLLHVLGDRHVVVEGEKRERVEQESHLHVEKNRSEKVGGTLSLGTTSYQVEVGKSFALESGDETHLACNEVLVGEGAADLTLKGPGGFLRIDGSGVTISGTLVQINVGGSSGSGSGAHPSPPKDPKVASAAPTVGAIPDPAPNPDDKDKKPPPPPPAWTPADLKANLDKCDGGLGIWAKAKAANGGKDPVVQRGASVIGSGGSVDTSTGIITLDQGQDKCNATQVQIQELSNLSHKADLEKADTDGAAGTLSRVDYIKAKERAEYDGVQNVIKAFDSCKKVWGCNTCEKEWARKYKTFDDYYDKALGADHKEYYGKVWDANYKAAYQAKHP